MSDDRSYEEQLADLLDKSQYDLWMQFCECIEGQYEMDRTWGSGGKAWDLEYKYRRGGKTLCALYAKEGCFGFMVILGKDERSKFEEDRASYSEAIRSAYDDAKTFHDGKWIMFEPTDDSLFDDYMRLLAIKRRPNRKQRQ